MIEKIKHLSVLKKLAIPQDQFALVGGCWFPILGIRSNNDIDLLLSEELRLVFRNYSKKLNPSERKIVDNSGSRTAKYLKISKSKTPEEFLKKHCITIDDYLIVKFWIFHEYKRKRSRRPKDRKDLKSIAKFFRTKQHQSEQFSFLPENHWKG